MPEKIHGNKGLMKNTKRDNDMRSEYDFAAMKNGVRGKYAKHHREGTNLVLLEPDISKAFPTGKLSIRLCVAFSKLPVPNPANLGRAAGGFNLRVAG
ncbi:MAG TPA: hypothetical protein VHA06_18740, partial [Candidatus Angelobacter sp.]|nr:hypothetical protein [Candidatus Angelobacter sp.]